MQFDDGTIWDITAIKALLFAGTPADDTIAGTIGADTINGSFGADTLYARRGNDLLNGGDGNDTLYGEAGNDTLDGGEGNNPYLFGRGDGQDTVVHSNYNTSPGKLNTLQFKAGVLPSDISVRRVNATGDSNYGLELALTGTSDRITAGYFFYLDDPYGAYNPVQQVRFDDGTTWNIPAILAELGRGTPANDNTRGTTGADVINGQRGNDTLNGAAGDDTLNGGEGNDALYGDAGNDTLDGGSGNNTYLFGRGDGQASAAPAAGRSPPMGTIARRTAGLPGAAANTAPRPRAPSPDRLCRTGDMTSGFRGRAVAVFVVLAAGGAVGGAAGGSAGGTALPPGAVEFDCLIEPNQTVELRSPVVGVLQQVPTRRGDNVRTGQLRVTVESSVEQSAVASARYKAEAQGALELARTKVDATGEKARRLSALYAEDIGSAQARDDAAAEFKLAQSELKSAEEAREMARLEHRQLVDQLKRRQLRSPFNGVVVDQYLVPGALVDAGEGKEPILKIAQTDLLAVQTFLPFRLYSQFRVGQPVVVVPEPPYGGEITATLRTVDRVIDSAAGTFGVVARLDNARQRLPAGIRCKLRLPGVAVR